MPPWLAMIRHNLGLFGQLFYLCHNSLTCLSRSYALHLCLPLTFYKLVVNINTGHYISSHYIQVLGLGCPWAHLHLVLNIYYSYYISFHYIQSISDYLYFTLLPLHPNQLLREEEIIQSSSGPRHLSTIPLKDSYLFKIVESVINFYLKKNF